jgi:hypothetical protein
MKLRWEKEAAGKDEDGHEYDSERFFVYDDGTGEIFAECAALGSIKRWAWCARSKNDDVADEKGFALNSINAMMEANAALVRLGYAITY